MQLDKTIPKAASNNKGETSLSSPNMGLVDDKYCTNENIVEFAFKNLKCFAAFSLTISYLYIRIKVT